MSDIEVTKVYRLRFTPHGVPDGTGCQRCRYVVNPPLPPGNLRADLWAAPTVPDRDYPTALDGRIIITPDDITWYTVCGDSNDQGWATYEDDRPAGTYGGNGCLNAIEADEVRCVPVLVRGDD